MEDIAKVRNEIEAAKEMIEKLKKTFTELESHRKSPLPNNTQWVHIQQLFNNSENAIKDKLNEVEEKEKLFVEKQYEAQKQISEREAVVAKLELASLDRIQEVKDKAVSAIEAARKNCKTSDLILVSNNSKTITSDDVNEEVNLDNSNYRQRLSTFQTRLKEFCAQMNPKGLLELFSEHRKYLIKTVKDLPAAIKCAADPGRFVLDSLEGFYPPEPANPQEIESSGPQFSRRVCLTLLEVVSSLMREDARYKNNENKEKAKAIADEWNTKLAGIDIEAANGQSLEAAAFLQLLVTFDIAEKFREDELCKLVFAITKRRQAPELCQALGLAHRIPGVIETLVKTGRHLDAVHFVCAFQLTESFPPVPLLDQFLENAKADTNEVTDIKEVYNKELIALRAITKCIEDYNLHDHYPLSPIKKKINKLEKLKHGAKRGGQQQAFKSQSPKKARSNWSFASKKPVYDTRATPYPTYDHRETSRYSYHAPPAYSVSPYPAPSPYSAPTALYPAPSPYDRTASYPPAPSPYDRSPYDVAAAYGYQSTAQASYHAPVYHATEPSTYSNAGYPGYHTTEPSTYSNAGYLPPAASYGYGSYYMEPAAAPAATATAYGSSTSAAAPPGAPQQTYM